MDDLLKIKPEEEPVRKSKRIMMKGANANKTESGKPYHLELKKKKQKPEKLDNRVELFMCVCEKTFSTKEAMLEHVKIVHAGDRYCCSICVMGKKNIWFKTKASLLRHCNQAMHDIPEFADAIPHAAFLIDSEDGSTEENHD